MIGIKSAHRRTITKNSTRGNIKLLRRKIYSLFLFQFFHTTIANQRF